MSGGPPRCRGFWANLRGGPRRCTADALPRVLLCPEHHKAEVRGRAMGIPLRRWRPGEPEEGTPREERNGCQDNQDAPAAAAPAG